jgi:hypothetical protein
VRHPFDGVILALAPEEQPRVPGGLSRHPESSTVPPPRRALLRALAALVLGGAAGLVSPREASGQRMTTQALGEEGGFSPPRHDGSPPGLGGDPPPRSREWPPGLRRGWDATTQALGEEGGPRRRPRWGGRVTTEALGEEGGRRIRGHGLATTEAFGEEGAGDGYPRFEIYR